jgi:divalent metal cation (Fe/Co/Zn/Cd) transporter
MTVLAEGAGPGRRDALHRARWLEWFSLSWNLVEALIAIGAALAAGSVALLGFGVDSVVESASAVILLWRLSAELAGRDGHVLERIERRAEKLVGASLGALAVYVAADAGLALIRREAPDPSRVGVALTAVSLFVMMFLARAKRRLAVALGSAALQADAFQTTACWWLSLTAMVGLALNLAFGWWWADPAAALAMTVFIGREGWDAWRGKPCDCRPAVGPAPVGR